MTRPGLVLLALLAWAGTVAAQMADAVIDPDHPAIAYGRAGGDPFAGLNARLLSGDLALRHEPPGGYLRSLLDALAIPVESQVMVFSGTSLQARLVNARNPRAIFFNDSTTVAWMAGGFIEVAALDPRQGASFYLLPQTPVPVPQLVRDDRCLTCHLANATLGVPGFLVRSIPAAVDGATLPWLGNVVTDHRTPLDERWAGWYVTGRGGRHLGNAPLPRRDSQELTVDPANLDLPTLASRLDTARYPGPYSDIVALLVFDHQMRMMNLLTRLGWETRVALQEAPGDAGARIAPLVADVVDYLLFVDEAPIGGAVRGSSGFAERFTASGRRDRQGRSLKDLDLDRRLLRYPCSYLILSPAFDALPAIARDAVYLRLWRVLSGAEADTRYARLSAADRRAIVEILSDTRDGWPASYTLPARP